MRQVFSDADLRSSVVEAVLDSHEVLAFSDVARELDVSRSGRTLAAWARGSTEGVAFLIENIFHAPDSDISDEDPKAWRSRKIEEHLRQLRTALLIEASN